MVLEITNSNLRHQDYFVLLNAVVGRGYHTADVTAPQNSYHESQMIQVIGLGVGTLNGI